MRQYCVGGSGFAAEISQLEGSGVEEAHFGRIVVMLMNKTKCSKRDFNNERRLGKQGVESILSIAVSRVGNWRSGMNGKVTLWLRTATANSAIDLKAATNIPWGRH
jgi:hypothetical protein